VVFTFFARPRFGCALIDSVALAVADLGA